MQCYRTLATVGLALIFSLSCLTANAQVPPNYPNSNNDWGTQVNPAPLPAHKAAKQEGTNPYVKSGPELGLDLGYGYLNTPADDMFRDTNINIPIPEQPDVTLKTATSSNHTLGGFVWGVHGGYNFAVSTNTLLGF
ncbi:MAG: hypothetical protein KAT71_04875, partial [Gammaproteobacteria bacterium]|nr:hypothetical protein [Gammaproteobacteria bacterium]